MPYSGPVADTHIHIQPWTMLGPAVLEAMRKGRPDMPLIEACIASPARFLEFLDECGIQRTMLINYPSPRIMGFDLSVNDFVGKYCRFNPVRMIACGGVLPNLVADVRGYIRHLAQDLGIRCLKIHPPHQSMSPNDYATGAMPALAQVYEGCIEQKLPVMIHTGTSIFPGARSRLGEVMPLDDVAVDFPDLKLILAHAGRPLWCDHAVFLVRRFPNVYIDISGIPPQKLGEYLPELPRIAHKTLWGTDWPSPGVTNPRKNIEQFLAQGYGEEVESQILWKTASALWPLNSSAP